MKELFLKGGIVMYPLLILSIVGLAVIFERLIYFFTVEKCDYEKLKDELVGFIKREDINGAIAACGRYNNSVSKALEAVIKSYADEENPEIMEERVRETALSQIPALERFMWVLGMTVNVAPLLGLLGTVIGMIKALAAISVQGVTKESVAGSISEALINTAMGLMIAIPATIIYSYLNKKIDLILNEIEKTSVEFINALGR
jgi:biopolymer transport protein ExbB